MYNNQQMYIKAKRAIRKESLQSREKRRAKMGRANLDGYQGKRYVK